MFIHLLTPRGLPWTRNGIPKTDYAHERLKRAKRDAKPEDLCKGMPAEFEEFLRYCRRLKFKDQPDYALWIDEFRGLAIDHGYPDSGDFIWPPVAPQVWFSQVTGEFCRMSCRQRPGKSTHTPVRMWTPAVERDEVEDILKDLKKLNLDGRRILGNKTNVEDATRKTQESAKKDNSIQKDIIEISSGSETNDGIPPPCMMPKALRLHKLTAKASGATNNLALSDLVREFVEVLQSNSSKTLTKEASHFLDVLHKQLADPSVFVTPVRYVFIKQSRNEGFNACIATRDRSLTGRMQERRNHHM
jgi:casein kinase 1